MEAKNCFVGNRRASPPDGNLCSLLHLGRPQLEQVAFCHIHVVLRRASKFLTGKTAASPGGGSWVRFPFFLYSQILQWKVFGHPKMWTKFPPPLTCVYLQTVQLQWSTPTRMREPLPTSLSSNPKIVYSSTISFYLSMGSCCYLKWDRLNILFLDRLWIEFEHLLCAHFHSSPYCAVFAVYALR